LNIPEKNKSSAPLPGQNVAVSPQWGNHAWDFCILAEVYRRICSAGEEPFAAAVLSRVTLVIKESHAVFGNHASTPSM